LPYDSLPFGRLYGTVSAQGKAAGDKGGSMIEEGGKACYQKRGAALRKEVMPMVQFLRDVLAGFLAAVLAALFLRHFDE